MAEAFQLSLPNGGVVTGLRTTPKAGVPNQTPLVVALHGGTYSASYFFADDHHSALPMSTALGVPIIAVNRPGYKESTALPPVPEDSTFLQEEGKYLHTQILPAIWKEYAASLGVSSIVLLTHSLGAPPAIVASALNVESKSYPLAGLIVSSIGTEWDAENKKGLLELLATKPPTIGFPNDMKDAVMLGTREEGMADPAIYEQTEALQTVMSFGECYDVQLLWLTYWTKYASKVDVPVMYGLAEHDWLWTASTKHVQEFAAAFAGSPRVESGLVLGTTHCMELSRVGRGWYARALGFAVECGVAKSLKKP